MGNKQTYKKDSILALAAAFTLLLEIPHNSFAATENYYKCRDRVGGEYNYGRAPQACNANAFGDDKLVFGSYGPLVFDDLDSRATERGRYVDEMNAVIRDAARYYIKKRKPSVADTELSWWVLGILSTASHESYWSHYRKSSDEKLKMMRGDYGHGHGLMQIDDRAHYPVIDKGIAWNLITNLTYAMDIFYKNWEKAPAQSCVKSATNYEARVRAAWAAYNGGSGKICRWTNPNDKWAQNDKNFYQHFSQRLWQKHLTDGNKKAAIDVACLMEKKENCPFPGGAVETPDLKPAVLYKSAAGSYCVIQNNKASCVKEYRDAICLKKISNYSANEAVTVNDKTLSFYQPVVLDRHALCAQYEPTLYTVGDYIILQKNTNLRATPGGGVLAVVPQHQSLTILDFELRNAPENDRYYKVQFKNQEGYIFAGSKTDYKSWAEWDPSSDWPGTVARVDEYVKIVNAAGINHRATPGGAGIQLIPQGTQLQVLDVHVESSNNKVYYKVRYQGQVGYIYTGFILPTDTTAQWTKVLR